MLSSQHQPRRGSSPTSDANRQRELGKVRHKLDELVEAIASGLRSMIQQNKLAQLEARQAELEQEVQAPSHKAVTLPPDLSAAYRQEVEQLGGSTEGTENKELIHSLIERVTITPTTTGNGPEVELRGEIAAMISMISIPPPRAVWV